MKCFHHNDLDGRCAAAIVRMARPDSVQSDFIEVDYKSNLDLSVVKHCEEVFIVDFSFSQQYMERLIDITPNVIWIDHHSTASSYPYANWGQNQIKGLRDFTVKGLSGCELTWKFLFPAEELNKSVQLIGDYDSWRMKLSPACLEFFEGMKLVPHDPCDKIWSDLLTKSESDSNALVANIRNTGKVCMQYRDMYCSEMRKSFGYETLIKCSVIKNGVDNLWTVDAYALNVYRFGSQAYGDLIEKYPVVIAYVHDGERYTVSLYSAREDIHCGEICSAFGGGGHKGAAGFVCDELPFVKAKS